MLEYLFYSLSSRHIVLLSLFLVSLVSLLAAMSDSLDECIVSLPLFMVEVGSTSLSSLLELEFSLLPKLSLFFTDVIFNAISLIV